MRLSATELECLTQLQSTRHEVAARSDIVHEGQLRHQAYILQAGWAYSYKLLPDGGRQIVTFYVPGDLMGLASIFLPTSDHSFAACTDCVVSSISLKSLITLLKQFPRLASAILWAHARDDAMVIEHLAGIGRRDAVKRVAHLFLELGHRLQLVGMANETSFECPLSQYLLADAVGLTAIHVNRVLRQLRAKGLMTFYRHHVVVNDMKSLTRLAGYDSSYLDQPRALTAIDK